MDPNDDIVDRRSLNFIPAVPAACSVTTIAFIVMSPCRCGEAPYATRPGALKPAAGISGRADTHSGIRNREAPGISAASAEFRSKDGE
jgi:hypothetical protein